jgi:putative membrane protein
MWHMDDGWGWWMVFGWLWMAVFWGLIIWGVVSLLRRLDDRTAPPQKQSYALGILEERYARGELTDAEFDRMRERLLRQPSPPNDLDGGP